METTVRNLNEVIEAYALSIARARGLFAETLDRLNKSGITIEHTPAVQGVLGRLVVGEVSDVPVP
jgi:hypothetical protein